MHPLKQIFKIEFTVIPILVFVFSSFGFFSGAGFLGRKCLLFDVFSPFYLNCIVLCFCNFSFLQKIYVFLSINLFSFVNEKFCFLSNKGNESNPNYSSFCINIINKFWFVPSILPHYFMKILPYLPSFAHTLVQLFAQLVGL